MVYVAMRKFKTINNNKTKKMMLKAKERMILNLNMKNYNVSIKKMKEELVSYKQKMTSLLNK
jgi:hypothetical protein